MRNDEKRHVPAATVPRLTLYLRKLRELQARGVERVASQELAAMIGSNAAQIRKDLSYFGGFGTRGVGYEVSRLIAEITRSLGLDRSWNVIIVGAGLLGTALARYRGFAEQGFRVVGVFDRSPTVIGASFGPGRVRSIEDLEAFCAQEHVDIALVTVPAAEAQGTVDRLARAGVRAVVNFAPVKVTAPAEVTVRPVDLSSELMVLTYALTGGEGSTPGP